MTRRSMCSRRPLAAAGALLLAVLATGCGSSSSSSTTTTISSTSSTSAARPSSTVAPATVASSHCRTDELRGSLGQSDAGAGQRYTALVLTNIGTRTCELRGFPGVSLLDAAGTQLGAAAGREGSEGATVPIPAGGTASATLHTNAAGTGGTCTAASTKLRVYPPDNTAALEFAASYTACGTFYVSTLVPGSTGR